ncbi:MAG TPA: UDP-N-acetyl glucosamine 2-epimerase, partial [Proteobacteria bacterium]|nr:UDP-N-acetyl glucosamine 2-epimerase [Pseudomonadota bacterium]
SVLTDSGGVQEEMNLLGKACLTCRFNTDRPETVNESHSNLLVTPINSDFIAAMVNYLYDNPTLYAKMSNGIKLYSGNVGQKFIDGVIELMDNGERPFSWGHEAQGCWREEEDNQEYLEF